MKSTVMLPLSFGCVTHLYTLFIAHHRKESTRVRRNKDAISAKARFINSAENTKSCSALQNSFEIYLSNANNYLPAKKSFTLSL